MATTWAAIITRTTRGAAGRGARRGEKGEGEQKGGGGQQAAKPRKCHYPSQERQLFAGSEKACYAHTQTHTRNHWYTHWRTLSLCLPHTLAHSLPLSTHTHYKWSALLGCSSFSLVPPSVRGRLLLPLPHLCAAAAAAWCCCSSCLVLLLFLSRAAFCAWASRRISRQMTLWH